MTRTKTPTLEDLRDRFAKNLQESKVTRGPGRPGALTIWLQRGVSRTFRAHWTGFKIFFPGEVLVVRAELPSAGLWTEAYISTEQPSWVLAFRSSAHPARGSSGRARPDDELSSPQQVDNAMRHRKGLIESGGASREELIRMEDYDDPLEAVDSVFNYTRLYVLKAAGIEWDQFGFTVDPSVGWQKDDEVIASVPIDSAIQEGLKKSDIIWITSDINPRRSVPCWFIVKDAKVYVLSGEKQQTIPDAQNIREATVVTRWKGRDARLVDFPASVRVITAADRAEFEELAELLVAKRQSVIGTPEENVVRWMRECVILELTPRV